MSTSYFDSPINSIYTQKATQKLVPKDFSEHHCSSALSNTSIYVHARVGRGPSSSSSQRQQCQGEASRRGQHCWWWLTVVVGEPIRKTGEGRDKVWKKSVFLYHPGNQCSRCDLTSKVSLKEAVSFKRKCSRGQIFFFKKTMFNHRLKAERHKSKGIGKQETARCEMGFFISYFSSFLSKKTRKPLASFAIFYKTKVVKSTCNVLSCCF